MKRHYSRTAAFASSQQRGDVPRVVVTAQRCNKAVEERRVAYRENPNPHFLTHGPKTRREFLANLKARGGSPI